MPWWGGRSACPGRRRETRLCGWCWRRSWLLLQGGSARGMWSLAQARQVIAQSAPHCHEGGQPPGLLGPHGGGGVLVGGDFLGQACFFSRRVDRHGEADADRAGHGPGGRLRGGGPGGFVI